MRGVTRAFRHRLPVRGGRGKAPSEEGAVAVEFALVAPLFLLLVFATMIFAIYFATFVAVIHSASEGARASIAGMSNAEREQLARARVQSLFTAYQPLLDPTRATVTASAVVASTTPSYRVAVAYPVGDFGFGWFFTFMNAVSGSSQVAPQTVSYSVTIANGGY